MDTSSSSSLSNDGEAMAVTAVLRCAVNISTQAKKKNRRGGSVKGRLPNRSILRDDGGSNLDRDYFCRGRLEPPIFSVQEFERRFTVTRSMYEKLRNVVCEHDNFFVQRSDCCGFIGSSTDQKMCDALRLLSSGTSADTCVDYFRLSETTLLLSLKRFCKAVVHCFSAEYLRRPNDSDIKAIDEQFSALGFPGCLGCVDCSGWEWSKCPVAMHGQFTGKDGKPTIRMEVVCDDKLWIWHLMFGVPGAKNHKSIVNQSTLFNDIRSGCWPPSRPNVNIAGRIVDWFYYLADGIYPKFRIFAKPHPNPTTPKEKFYKAAHSSARKSVERVFGVLDAQFEILRIPARMFDLNDLCDIATTCVIIHNMIVEQRGYAGTAKFRVGEEMRQCAPTTISNIDQRFICSYQQAAFWRETLDAVESLDDHTKLLEELMDKIWNTHGDGFC